MRQVNDITKKSRIRLYIFIYSLLMMVIAVASFYTVVYVISDQIKTQSEQLIQSYSDKTAALVRSRMEDMDNFFSYMDFCISNDLEYQDIQAVKTMYENLHLVDMWVCEKGGGIYSYRQQKELEASDQEIYQEITANGQMVTTKCVQGGCRTYAVRQITGEDQEVLATVVLIDKLNVLQQYLSQDIQMSGRLEQCLINASGQVYYSSIDPAADDMDILNLLRSEEKSAALADQMQEVLEGSLESKFIYFDADEEKLAYVEKLSNRELYLLTIVPTSALKSQAGRVFLFLQATLIGLIVFAALSIIYLFLIKKQYFKEVRYVIYHDAITDGINYLSFKRKAAEQIQTGKWVFLLFNIKKFKIFNDIFGFAEGDRLLKTIHQILKKHCGKEELLCRAYSDHFCVLWEYRDKKEAQERLNALLADLEELDKQNQRFKIEFSIGVSYVKGFDKPDQAIDFIDLLYSEAAIACQCKKDDSGNTFCEYDLNLGNTYMKRKFLQDRMIKALEEKDFQVWYQPKYDLETSSYCSCEALARPGAKIIDVTTGEFIKFFEESGRIGKFDLMIFEKVCRDIQRWKAGHKRILPISLNLSRENTYDFQFIDACLALMEEYHISHDLIQFEITETRPMLENQYLSSLCTYLHQQGFAILLDDFGVGYSSISTLVDIPFDILKLDIALIRKIGSREGEKILKSLILLAESLDKKLIAEGVETAEQEQFLKQQGVSVMQGYRYQKPLAPDIYEKLLIDFPFT